MLIQTIKALADPSRLRLVAVLQHGEFTVQELTAILRMGQSRVSRHLRILLDAEVVEVQRQGTWSYYRLGGDALFSELIPLLSSRFRELPGHSDDLTALAGALEERRRRSRDFFDRHARQWDALVRDVLPVAGYLEQLVAAVPRCDCMVEVGVGTGALLAALGERGGRVIAVDHSPAMLEQARARVEELGLDGVELRIGEMAHLPLGDGEAGAALTNMVLHHAPRPAEVLGELYRTLAPGGTLLIADLVRHEREWVRERLADQWLGFDRGELEAMLATAGFAVERYTVVAGEGEALDAFILVARKGRQRP